MIGFSIEKLKRVGIFCAFVLLLAGCAQKTRMGMVTDPDTGLMYGSTIEKSLVTEPSFYRNRKIKVRTRNTSGDLAFGLDELTEQLNTIYANKGYQPTSEEDFGLILDVNVIYSGHIQNDSASLFSFLGGAAGSIFGARSSTAQGQDIGLVTGATVGGILGTHVSEDTYMIVARVTFASVKKSRLSKKTVTFSGSEKLKNIDDPDEEEQVYNRGLKKTYTTQVAVYAGGQNVKQSEITREVRNRIIRIVGDYI